MSSFRASAAVLALLCASACDEPRTSSSTGPGGTVNLTGSFASTSVVDSAGYNSMRWVLTQTGNQVSGTLTVAGNGQTGTGTVAGTLANGTLTFTMTVPPEGYVPGLPSCSSTTTGTAPNVTNDTISGTYAGTHTCVSTPISGTMQLRRE